MIGSDRIPTHGATAFDSGVQLRLPDEARKRSFVLALLLSTWVPIGSTVLAQALRFAVGATLGLTIAHFVIDAGAWRLSQRPQRAYMTKRFGFVFTPRPRLTAAAES